MCIQRVDRASGRERERERESESETATEIQTAASRGIEAESVDV